MSPEWLHSYFSSDQDMVNMLLGLLKGLYTCRFVVLGGLNRIEQNGSHDPQRNLPYT
jgi:hypothetical protein